MEGVVEGGWGFVIAAYSVVWGTIIVYGATLFARRASAEREAKSENS